MRSATFLASVLVVLLLLPAVPAGAAEINEEIQTAKVYRDYPGYVNPAVCENPNVGKASAPCPEPTAESTGFYVAVRAGVVATDDLDIARGVDMSVDNGYGLGLAVGYDFGQVRMEIEGIYREGNGDRFKTAGGTSSATDDLTVEGGLVNGYVDFDLGGSTAPYLGAGAGIVRAEVGSRQDDVGVAQLAAGFLFNVTPSMALDLGYRYLLPVAKSDFDLRQHTALLGLQIRF